MANTKSIALDNSSLQYLSITDANQTGLDFSTAFTFMGWVKFDSLPIASGRAGFMFKWEVSAGTGRTYHVGLFNNSGTYFVRAEIANTGDTDEDQLQVNWTPTVSTWYHVATTWDGTAKTMRLYVNGSLVGTSAVGSIATLNNGTEEFRLGTWSPGVEKYNLDGKMDEVGVYNTSLTLATISSDYNSGDGTERSGSETGIQGAWRFEDNLTDLTANDNDLTNNNSGTYSSDVPFAGSTTATTPTDSEVNISDSQSITESIESNASLADINPTSLNKKTVRIWS